MPLGYTRIIEQNVRIHAELITHSCAQNIHGNIRCMLELSLTVSLQIPRSVHSFFFPHPSPTSSIKKLFMMYKKNDELIPAQKLEYALFCLHSWLVWLLPIRESPSCQLETCGRLQVCFENPSAPFSPFIRMGVVGRIFTEGNFEHWF